MKKLAFFLLLLAAPAFAFASSATYKVKAGDTWEIIAAEHKITLQKLVDMNQPKAGEIINVPGSVPPPEVTLKAYLTGYSDIDNTPANSNVTWLNGVAGTTGGSGTYSDPTTVAVGFVGSAGDFPYGTVFYVPNLERYFVAQDTCADCHTVKDGQQVHLDLYISGESQGAAAVDSCADSITGDFNVIENPSPDYKVDSGSVLDGSCSAQYGNTPLPS
jgi:LysM repeat protein